MLQPASVYQYHLESPLQQEHSEHMLPEGDAHLTIYLVLNNTTSLRNERAHSVYHPYMDKTG